MGQNWRKGEGKFFSEQENETLRVEEDSLLGNKSIYKALTVYSCVTPDYGLAECVATASHSNAPHLRVCCLSYISSFMKISIDRLNLQAFLTLCSCELPHGSRSVQLSTITPCLP